jgi:cysteinyl-tRNA synthetase
MEEETLLEKHIKHLVYKANVLQNQIDIDEKICGQNRKKLAELKEIISKLEGIK